MKMGNENGKMMKDMPTNEYEYSDAELHEMGECLLKAKEIQSDSKLYKIVMQAMNVKVDKIKSLDQLRAKQKEVEMRDNDMEKSTSGDEE